MFVARTRVAWREDTPPLFDFAFESRSRAATAAARLPPRRRESGDEQMSPRRRLLFTTRRRTRLYVACRHLLLR